jgi:hypothetical protein
VTFPESYAHPTHLFHRLPPSYTVYMHAISQAQVQTAFKYVFNALIIPLAICTLSCHPTSRPEPTDGLGHFAARTDHLQRLEPHGQRILHGAGLSFDPHDANKSALQRARPLVYAVYYDLASLRYDWHLVLRAQLDQYEDYVLPQIDLGFSFDGRPYEDAIAQGQLDQAIERLCFGLRELRRPVLLRPGLQFNNPWNAYDAEHYSGAWQRLASTLRGRWGLEHVALVWTYWADGYPDYMAYYPGDQYVDWWSIDVATPQDLAMPRSHAFITAASERGYPVLLGAATPASADLSQAEQAWAHWFAPLLRFLRRHPNIKAFTYMTWDWAQMNRFADPVLFERYRNELMHPIYQHSAPLDELRWNLELER